MEGSIGVFGIGHHAYQNENRMAYVSGKAAAVRELRSRGVKRDEARDAVKRAAEGSHAVCCGGPSGLSPIEIILLGQGAYS
jgi:hypothetical protein